MPAPARSWPAGSQPRMLSPGKPPTVGTRGLRTVTLRALARPLPLRHIPAGPKQAESIRDRSGGGAGPSARQGGGSEAMKIQVEIDCTPDEARRFLGLPDLAPMQEAVLARIQQRMIDAISATGPDALLKAWMPMLPQTPDQMRDQLLRMFTAPFAPPAEGGGQPLPGGASPPRE